MGGGFRVPRTAYRGLRLLTLRTLDAMPESGRCLPRCLVGRVNSRSTMDSPSKFLAPGSDGEHAPGTDLWRKGLVYTTRGDLTSLQSNLENYRISVLFKKGLGAAQPFTGFNEVYRRVVAIASHRISQTDLRGDRGSAGRYHLVPRMALDGREHRHGLDHFTTSMLESGLDGCARRAGSYRRGATFSRRYDS
jgi:hypothetical protein